MHQLIEWIVAKKDIRERIVITYTGLLALVTCFKAFTVDTELLLLPQFFNR
jgi:hypothetical protein